MTVEKSLSADDCLSPVGFVSANLKIIKLYIQRKSIVPNG